MKAQRIIARRGGDRRTEVELAVPDIPYAPHPAMVAIQHRQLTLPDRSPTAESNTAAIRDGVRAGRARSPLLFYKGVAYEGWGVVAEGFARVEEQRVATSGLGRFLGRTKVQSVVVDALTGWQAEHAQPGTAEYLRASLMHAALRGLDGEVAVQRPVYGEDGTVSMEDMGAAWEVRSDIAGTFPSLAVGAPQVMDEATLRSRFWEGQTTNTTAH